MATYRTSAGSFVLHPAKPKNVTTYIHHGGEAACGGGGALSPQNIEKTAQNVANFMKEELGWSSNVATAVKEQLQKMILSANPTEHAMKLHKYYAKHGIKHRAIIENVETGKRETIAVKGNWLDWIFGENAACADARHRVKGKGRKQEEQSPKGFYFGENPVPKNTHNKTFTIAGVSPAYIQKVSKKAEKGEKLDSWEAHNLAAVSLSAYYYCHHKWPNYAELEALLKK